MTLQQSFDKIQLELPYTRLMRYDSELVFSISGDIKFALQKVNRIINDMGLTNLKVESGEKINGTIVIKSKK